MRREGMVEISSENSGPVRSRTSDEDEDDYGDKAAAGGKKKKRKKYYRHTADQIREMEAELSTMGLKGSLGGDIGGLSELRSLDLSFNQDLTAPLSRELGQLSKLNILILAGCGFSGIIPNELGKWSQLSFL